MNEASTFKDPLMWSDLYTHIRTLSKTLDTIEALGHAAHDAGATSAQHELEKAHSAIDKALHALYRATHEYNQTKGESK